MLKGEWRRRGRRDHRQNVVEEIRVSSGPDPTHHDYYLMPSSPPPNANTECRCCPHVRVSIMSNVDNYCERRTEVGSAETKPGRSSVRCQALEIGVVGLELHQLQLLHRHPKAQSNSDSSCVTPTTITPR